MRFISIGVKWPQILVLTLLPLVLNTTSIGSCLTADEIMRQAVARAQRPEESRLRQHSYAYTKMSVTEELDSSGRVKNEKKKVWQVTSRSGRTSSKLVEVNGKPPPVSELKKQAEAENNAHQMLGEDHGANLENRDNLLTPELVGRFDFKLIGITNVAERPAYVLTFSAKSPPLPEHHLVDRLLNQLSGTIWIDEAEFELAHANLKLSSPVDLWGGLIGCLKNLAYTITRARLDDGFWVKTTANGDFEGRKLFEPVRIRIKSQISNLRFEGKS